MRIRAMDTMDESEMQRDEYTPKCPICGEYATFRDSMGTYWDSNAHHWQETWPEEDL